MENKKKKIKRVATVLVFKNLVFTINFKKYVGKFLLRFISLVQYSANNLSTPLLNLLEASRSCSSDAAYAYVTLKKLDLS